MAHPLGRGWGIGSQSWACGRKGGRAQRVCWTPEFETWGAAGELRGGPDHRQVVMPPHPSPGLQVRVLPAALPPVPQPVCTYHELHFASIRLPGCPPGVDPMVSFPVALSCRCGPCRLSNSDCGGPRAQSLACDRPLLPGLLFL